MAKETFMARERNANPLNSERARRSGHTADDYRSLYSQMRGGLRRSLVEGRITESEYKKRMADIERRERRLG